MDNIEKESIESPDLIEQHKDEITPAYQRAVRDAVLRHKRNGHPIAIARHGKVVILQPDEIEPELERAAKLLESDV
jgi:hypothetical protein